MAGQDGSFQNEHILERYGCCQTKYKFFKALNNLKTFDVFYWGRNTGGKISGFKENQIKTNHHDPRN